MTKETWREFAAQNLTPRARIRKVARDAIVSAVSASSLIARKPSGNFLRLLYCHYVFDDQCDVFERKMRQALDWGEFVTTRDAVAMIKGDVPITGRYYHLSFDDGLHCLLRNAAPILLELKIPSICFVNSTLAGDHDSKTELSWRKATNYRGPVRVMSWDELREIRATGMEIGAHGRTHKRLSSISRNYKLLRDEISGCKADIEAEMGESCRFFAWPFGKKEDIDTAVIDVVREEFEASFGVFRERIIPGLTNPFMIPRHHFEPHWPHRHFAYFANGGGEA